MGIRKLQPAEFDDILFDEDDDFAIEVEEEEYKEPDEWSIITALDRVLNKARGSELSKEFWETCKNPIAFLTKELGLSEIQVVFIAILVEAGEAMSWRKFGKFLNCSRLSIMVHTEEIEVLVEKRWIFRRGSYEHGGFFEGFALARGVVTALRHNKPFVPEKIDGLDIQQFMERLEAYLDKNLNNNNGEFQDDEKWMIRLCKANTHLELCRTILGIENNVNTQSLLMLIAYDYAQFADSENEGLYLSTFTNLYPEEYECNRMRHRLKEGSHILMQQGYIEHKCEDGIANTERYVLTARFKEELLQDYTPSKSKCAVLKAPKRDIKSHTGIKAKDMFYNDAEQKQIERLTALLGQENLSGIQERLEAEGMRKGFACLFYGAPGTGKTETVMQIARQTGRDIMQIDIAGMRDKFVGESEKNIKAVFARYRKACEACEVMPILFFNEADAIFGKRTTIGGNNPSVEKMDNAMQNIILQEMEDLEGILIATTNLTCNLDDAFERRFLFKVEFNKPDNEIKAKLWTSMLGNDITEDDARILASRYDFSGGQIENIARKRTIEFILSGEKSSFEKIDEFCRHELLEKKNTRKPIGF